MSLCQNCLSTLSNEPHTLKPPHDAPDTLLLQNISPNPVEAQDLRNRIAIATSNAEALETKIEQLRALLVQYEDTRDSCLKYVERHRRVLSAVHAVPPEVWSQIFQWRQQDHDMDNKRSGPFDGPLQLRSFSRVSPLWRRVALRTPSLWSSIYLSEPLPPSAVTLLDMWLQRSNMHPLRVSIHRCNPESSGNKIFFQCVNLLVRHVKRWRDFTLDMYADESEQDSMHLWPAVLDAPELQSCSLTFFDMSRPLFSSIPQLRHLKLAGSLIGADVPPLMPWTSITHLELGYGSEVLYDVVEQAALLRECLALEELIIWSGDGENQEDFQIEPFSHSVLKCLSILNGSGGIMLPLTAPALVFLHLDCDGTNDYQRVVSNFFGRSPNLQHLRIGEKFSIISDLTRVKQVKILDLNVGHGDPEALAGIIQKLAHPTSILPDLEVFTFAQTQKFSRTSLPRGRFLDPLPYLSLRDSIQLVVSERLWNKTANKRKLRQITVQICLSEWQETAREAFAGLKDSACEGLAIQLNVY